MKTHDAAAFISLSWILRRIKDIQGVNAAINWLKTNWFNKNRKTTWNLNQENRKITSNKTKINAVNRNLVGDNKIIKNKRKFLWVWRKSKKTKINFCKNISKAK